MINTKLYFKDSINSKKTKNVQLKSLSKKFDKIFLEIESDIKNTKKTLNVLDKNFNFNFNFKDLNKFKKFKTIALIGMGGSILGAEAIYNFFQTKIKKRIFFFNDLDENKITNFKKEENLKNVLFIIISKSGNTVETLSNTFALNILKKNSKNIIIISEKKNNLLFVLSKKLNLFYIEHKDYIGGRYSVLSEVGIIPAYIMGIDITKLRLNILESLKGKNKNFLKKSSIKIARLLNSKKKNSLIFLNYFPELEKFLYWYQQLIAESLGKKGKGFLPVVSNPKDHHSFYSYILMGQRINYFIFLLMRVNLRKKLALVKILE